MEARQAAPFLADRATHLAGELVTVSGVKRNRDRCSGVGITHTLETEFLTTLQHEAAFFFKLLRWSVLRFL